MVRRFQPANSQHGEMFHSPVSGRLPVSGWLFGLEKNRWFLGFHWTWIYIWMKTLTCTGHKKMILWEDMIHKALHTPLVWGMREWMGLEKEEWTQPLRCCWCINKNKCPKALRSVKPNALSMSSGPNHLYIRPITCCNFLKEAIKNLEGLQHVFLWIRIPHPLPVLQTQCKVVQRTSQLRTWECCAPQHASVHSFRGTIGW